MAEREIESLSRQLQDSVAKHPIYEEEIAQLRGEKEAAVIAARNAESGRAAAEAATKRIEKEAEGLVQRVSASEV